MFEDRGTFEDNLAILAVLLMRAHGNKVVVTQGEIADAREFLRDNQVQMVAYDRSRLFGDEVVVEFRSRSRRVLAGEVVGGQRG